jgi:hypothetical protein
VSPSIALNNDEISSIELLIKEWIPKFNIQNACLHFEALFRKKSWQYEEMILDDRKNMLMPIEINLRMGGCETYSMILTSFDVDLMLSQLDISLGNLLSSQNLEYKLKNPLNRCISMNYRLINNIKINEINVQPKNLNSNEDIVEVAIIRSTGDIIINKEIIGYGVAKNKIECSLNELKAKMNHLLDSIQLQYSKIEN